MLTEITVEIPAHIAQQPVTLPTSLTAELEHAVAAIARIESRSEHLGGLGELLVRSEAVASSKIEHVYSTLDDIARASVDADVAAGGRSTVAASRALTALTDSCAHAPLTHDASLEAHQRLLDGDLREAQFAGKYRPMQNWIGGSDLSPRDAVHVPPPAANVRPLMDDLLAFHSRTDMPAVAQCTSTAAEAALESADHLAAMPAAWHEKITARRGSASRTLVDGLLSSPVLDIGRAEKVARASRRRAYEALDHLTDAGVLEEITGSARSRVWVASDVMDELGELEDRIGHRCMPSTEWR
ncbi:Fic family protein [Demequina capsici]|uniref:Fic/DOC N-terminal domain-containing protein n=1 Tax=Demequina capsici TaxID=3075620 RepID=A0AA96J7T4_9MICO|nr:Fic/DOC family N-terminal domain-containing protein [Demequina sp. OYTSA14]WNM24313.1 hypothetical protein RN606_13260 [Demequina sp. OYTSA14]